MTPLAYYIVFSALLFSVGLAGALTRRNAILVLIGIELMLNAANLNFIAFWRYGGTSPASSNDISGLMFVIFSIAIAAAEAAVGLAIIIAVYRHYRTTQIENVNNLNG